MSYSTSSSSGTTLYAVWWSNWYVRLLYFPNGGTSSPDNEIDTVTQYSQPSSKTFIISDVIPIREGYDFMGWDTDRGAEVGSYHAGDSIDVAYGLGEYATAKNLYAIWKTKQSSVKVKVDGTWKSATVHVGLNCVWTVVKKNYSKIGGVWKSGV